MNLVIPSEVKWQEKGLVLRQDTRFPEEGKVTFTVGLDEPKQLTVRLRYPSWSSEVCVKVNGKKVKVRQKPGSYILLSRRWKDGDRIEADYAMGLRLERTPDGTERGALLYGPVVLAGELGPEGMEAPAPYSDQAKDNDYYSYDYQIPEGLPRALRLAPKNTATAL